MKFSHIDSPFTFRWHQSHGRVTWFDDTGYNQYEDGWDLERVLDALTSGMWVPHKESVDWYLRNINAG